MKRVFLKSLGVILTAMLLSGCPRVNPDTGAQTPLTAPEKQALEILSTIHRTAQESGDAIWPGFAPDEVPLLVFRPGKRSFLINPHPAPTGLGQVVFRGLTVPVYAMDSRDLGINPNLPFAKNARVPGGTAFLVRHTDSSKKNQWFRLVVHELFHNYQQLHWDRGDFPEACRYPYDDVTNGYLGLVEAHLLAGMLPVLHDGEALAKQALAYLAVRSMRHGRDQAGEIALPIEEWEELVEGTARYTEELYAIAAGLSTMDKAVAELSSFLRQFAPRNLQKWKYYRTGTALALVLDALGYGKWKDAAGDGIGQFQFWLEKLGAGLADLPSDEVARIVAEFEDQRSSVQEALEAYLKQERETIDNWAPEGQYRVTVVLPERGGAYYVNRGLTIQLEDCSRLASGVINFVDNQFGLQISKRGVAVRNLDFGYQVVFYHNLKDGLLSLDGEAAATADGSGRFATSLKADFVGFKLALSGAGEFLVDGDAVYVSMD